MENVSLTVALASTVKEAPATCMTCPPGTALHDGKCINQCPPQHYMDNHSRCRDCHPSCRSCVGPLASDCLLCLKPEEVLLPQSIHLHHGICRGGCSSHTFLDDKQTCRGRSFAEGIEEHAHSQTKSQPHQLCPPQIMALSAQNKSVIPPAGSVPGRLQTTVRPVPPRPACMKDAVSPAAYKASLSKTISAKQDADKLADLLERRLISSRYRDGRGQQKSYKEIESLFRIYQLASLESGHCRTNCKEGNFLNVVTGECLRCHPSCESCSGAGPLSCTSCHANSVLVPSGLCAPKCPLGYFDNGDRICQACDSQCLTCDMAGVCTSCRDPAKVLLFGECQYDSCAHQYYLNTTTRACRECDWSCNACKGPLRTDCLQCMEGYVLQDGVCTQGCSPGFYQDGDRCLGCDEHCLKCHGPGQCEQCQPPFSTLLGHCVLECGRNYFLDTLSQLCKPCSSDCVLCDGVGHCRVCRDQTYLMEGYCTPDCGHGFYADQKTKTCHGHWLKIIPRFMFSNDWFYSDRFSLIKAVFCDTVFRRSMPHKYQVNGSLLVPLGGFAPLPPTLLHVKDPDSPSERLIFQLIRGPSNGRLVLLRAPEGEEEGGRELTRDDTFTWAELRTGRVRFRHQKDKARTGEFTLRAADPQLFSQPETVQVQAVSMQPPKVVTLSTLPVDGRGAVATITKSVLQVDDPDNPADVLVMVLEPPRHGRLTRLHGDWTLSRFKLEELSREQIQYVHDGSEGTEDKAVLQVNDGHSYRNILFQIHISQKAHHPGISSACQWQIVLGTISFLKVGLLSSKAGD
ncbi:Extracellular matrix protein FRAS1 Precursor [Channa argus]|uniref:Extracellular matrix protein FRAS1 n=1 Tax=Channa argus TaxID=215402 RepID=A0A6G1PYL1_CHAAH|nr:Extracellular matrix protein FRAS1 Precursor [Channa argus]